MTPSKAALVRAGLLRACTGFASVAFLLIGVVAAAMAHRWRFAIAGVPGAMVVAAARLTRVAFWRRLMTDLRRRPVALPAVALLTFRRQGVRFRAGPGVAAGYRPRDDDVYVMYTEVGQQVARFTMRDGHRGVTEGPMSQRALLHERFGKSGWECPEILAAMERAPDLYFDRVSQIRMDRRWRGRVALVGDAAFCISLLAGQGSALAMVASYVLVGELTAASGDYGMAFQRYQARLGGFIRRKQDAAARFAGYFAPRSKLRLFVRNQVTKLLALPPSGGEPEPGPLPGGQPVGRCSHDRGGHARLPR